MKENKVITDNNFFHQIDFIDFISNNIDKSKIYKLGINSHE